MSTNVIFLLIEYSAIPIGLMGYNFIISQLASADPITKTAKKTERLHYGLELMQIVSVSTLLYGLGHFGNARGEPLLAEDIVVPVLISFSFFISEFFVIIFVTLKVRHWGKVSPKTKICTNCVAFLFWLMLVGLILSTSDKKSSWRPTTENPQVISYSMPVHDTLAVLEKDILSGQTRTSTHPGSKRTYFYAFTGIMALMGVIIFTLMQLSIRRSKKAVLKNYSTGAALMSKDPTAAIRKLRHSLSSTPANSPLFIDTNMKLARIYNELGDPQKALSQINALSTSEAFEKYVYLRTGILCFKFELLVNMNQLDEAEKVIGQIQVPETVEKLQLKLLHARKPATS